VINLAQTTAPVVTGVLVEVVSNGFIITPQQQQTAPFTRSAQSVKQVYNDFPDAVAALAALLGVTLPAASVTAAITAAQIAPASTTATASTQAAPPSP